MSTGSSSTKHKTFSSSSPYAEPLWYSRNLTPHYTESHRKLRAAVRKYINDEIIPYVFEWELAGKVPDSASKRHAEFGYLATNTELSNVPLPGGIPFEEWGSWHSLILMDEISRLVCRAFGKEFDQDFKGFTGVLWGLGGGNSIGVPPIVNFGTPKQKATYLPGVATCEIQFCLRITEPDGLEPQISDQILMRITGSDVANIKTTQSKKEITILSPVPRITNGIWADYVTAAAGSKRNLSPNYLP
ncbi:hypothetical protein B7494_g2168 [Chlorociboria aeruginascens]|nr:hypothetical protein B7494_g2168 [Chlorociboria aeruginascens]